jgi:hypothetical protein
MNEIMYRMVRLASIINSGKKVSTNSETAVSLINWYAAHGVKLQTSVSTDGIHILWKG